MAKTENIVIEKYEDGTVAVLDRLGTVRIISGSSFEEGQVILLDTEALDIAEASMDEESTKRALAGDYEPRVIRFPDRVKRSMVRHTFPIAASFALAFIFGLGGSVYAYGEVAEMVEMDGVSYDLNYFNKVIAVSVPDADEEMLRELKKNTHGKKIDEAQTIVEESLPHPEKPATRVIITEEENVSEEPEKDTEIIPDRENAEEDATEDVVEDTVDEPLDVPTRVNNDKPAEPEKKQDIPGGDAEKEKPQKAPMEETPKDDFRPAEKKEESKPDAESQPNAGSQPDMGTQPDAGTQPDGGARPDMETKPDMGSQPDGSHLDGPPR